VNIRCCRAPQGPSVRSLVQTLLLVLAVPSLAAAQTSAAEPVDSTDAGSVIRSGDLVRVSVWREEHLNGEFPVNEFGTVVLPMIGELQAAGRKRDAFRAEVLALFRERLVNPSIEVIVLRRVRILGEVNEPGVYPLDPTMTLADALATAGGRTPLARQDEIILRRGGRVVETELGEETLVGETPIRSGDELEVPQRSWLDRNAAAVIGGASAFIGLVVTLIAR
jgi:polysaccharide export outer membrane protein